MTKPTLSSTPLPDATLADTTLPDPASPDPALPGRPPHGDATDAGAPAEQRGRLRERRLLLSAVTMLLGKGISAATALISLPLTLNYLGPERYGMWATIASAILVFNLADLGIGNGMLNRVSAAYGRRDWDDIRRVAANATALLALIAAGIVAVLALVYPFVPWHAVFNVQSELARAEAGPATALFILFWSLRLPLSIVQRVQFGMQLGHVSNGWDIAGSLASLAAIVLATRLDAGVYLLVAAFAGVPVAVQALNNLVFYRFMRPDVSPPLRTARIADAVPIIKAGLLILMLQMTGALIAASDSFVIAQVLGAEAVASFAVADRLFSLIPVAVLVVSHSMWPAFAEASAGGDVAWIRRTLARALAFALIVSTLLSTLLVLTGPAIIRVWIQNAVQPTMLLLLAMGIWKVFESSGSMASIYLNARGLLREQVLPSLLYCTIGIALKFGLVAAIGVSGGVWASTIAFVTILLVPYGRLIAASLRRDRDRQRST